MLRTGAGRGATAGTCPTAGLRPVAFCHSFGKLPASLDRHAYAFSPACSAPGGAGETPPWVFARQGIRCAESWRTVPIMPAAGQLRANPRQTRHKTFAAARRDAMMPRRICRRDRPGVSAGAVRPAPCAPGDPGFRLPAAAKKRRPAKATNPSREMFEVSTDICPHPGAVVRGSLARLPGNCRESRHRVRPAWDRI